MEGILAGEQPPDEMIRWFSHAGVTARRVVDVALVVDALQDPAVVGQPLESARELKSPKRLRVGVANNFKADAEVARVFANAVEVVAKLGHVLKQVVIPFAGPGTGLSNIDRDRKSVRRVLFDDIDVLLLPTTTTAVPRTASASHPQALSPENTVFANYYGIPAMSVPCGFDSHGLPLGLQIVGGPSADLDVLALGGQYEAAAGWRSNHPKI
jgi:aspartyl-tRNA(Asn)/glutamyl-tRNA(Gln) amidotransferase subunit A